MRVSAWLRLPLIVLILLLGSNPNIQMWHDGVYYAVLAVYTVSAIVWVAIAVRGHVPLWVAPSATAVDIAAVVALCVASGYGTSELLPVFFLLPVSVAFQERPAVTAVLGTVTAAGYLGVLVFYTRNGNLESIPGDEYVTVATLLWLAAATAGMCFVLKRRSEHVGRLLHTREQLVLEAMRADERHSREVAEQLHDGPLQNLLAARLEIEEVLERHPDPVLRAVHSSLRDTATELRGAVSSLHPQVLAELGLTAAIRELARQYTARGSVVVAELQDVGSPPAQPLVYRAAKELLTNAVKHGRAKNIHVELTRDGQLLSLVVADDGNGFDPRGLTASVADGHIGLASLTVPIEAAGGSVAIASAPGSGTRVSVTVPADMAA
ncbi:histidine kinase [Mycobacterium sp. CBMA271]|uniref:sensor histidine kinase n=1 Tax=unclassified Mycobacteroides TaxID=2618759 RepID=UPI0012DF87CE|nr:MULTISPECIES: ATP-binding protein [unclassified Mycobacteroides]MUM18123.1 histidine kinase [Mycobacteroides sp. CBMA 326]MUM23393.1 histidine kinase [Mycobacteroides sp. CBMA 271]